MTNDSTQEKRYPRSQVAGEWVPYIRVQSCTPSSFLPGESYKVQAREHYSLFFKNKNKQTSKNHTKDTSTEAIFNNLPSSPISWLVYPSL